jgi:hypothetical protein
MNWSVSDHGYLRGNKRISFVDKSNGDESLETKPSERRTLMDLVIETVAKCSEEYDDGVHIQVRKLLVFVFTFFLGSWSFVISRHFSEL